MNLIVEDVIEILATSAQECAPQRRIVKRRRRTNVWGPEIAAASKDSKRAFFKWKMAGKPVDPNNQTYTEMKLKKKKKTHTKKKPTISSINSETAISITKIQAIQ